MMGEIVTYSIIIISLVLNPNPWFEPMESDRPHFRENLGAFQIPV